MAQGGLTRIDEIQDMGGVRKAHQQSLRPR